MASEHAQTTRLTALALTILFALLVTYAGIAVFWSAAGALFRYQQNFNEGWIAYFSQAAYQGQLYFTHDAPVTNNYPPLSFYLIGGLAKLGGDPIYIGRALSAVALVGVALNLYAIARLLDTDRAVSAFCAVAFLGFIAIGFPDYFVTADPQWLGHFIMITGLTLFVAGYPRRGAVIGAALVMLAAGLVKHNLLPIPLAVTVWLLLYGRLRLVSWIVTCLLGIAAVATFLWAVHGAVAFEAILLMKRQYLLLQVANTLYEFVAPTVPLLVLAALCGAWSDVRSRLVFLYAVIALVWDVFTMGAVGVAYNGILDYYIAMALLTAVSIGRLDGMARLASLVAVVFPLVLVASQLTKPHRVWEERLNLEAESRDDEAILRSHPGDAICISTALCFWAGKAFVYDPFNEVRKMNLDRDYREKFKGKLDRKQFAVIQLKRLERGLPIHNLAYFPEDVIDAIEKNYEFEKRSKTGRLYFVPRRD